MAKPFSFKLQKVLDYRTQLEDQAKGALAMAKRAFDTQAVQVADLEARLSAHLGKAAQSSGSANDLWLWRQYKAALEQDLSRERIALTQLEHKLHKCRQHVLDCSKEKKLLQKLKETQARKHNAHETARETKENDEMATVRYEREDI